MLGDAFEVRKAASSAGFAGERPDDGPANGRPRSSQLLAQPPCGERPVPRRPLIGRAVLSGPSPTNATLLAAFLTSKASPSIQNLDFGVDIAKIRNLRLCKSKSSLIILALEAIGAPYGDF